LVPYVLDFLYSISIATIGLVVAHTKVLVLELVLVLVLRYME
jgi:hypothetical protein